MAATDQQQRHVEGIARVVQAQDGVLWLEPEQTTSCGACAAAGQCGSKGIGSLARPHRGTTLCAAQDGQDFGVGERVVIGVGAADPAQGSADRLWLCRWPRSLIAGRRALRNWFGGDVESMAAAAVGLAVGLLLARLGARRLSARGELAPRFLRRARPGESCGGKGEA
jgi:sigma-E factor negative regulatory protein RseC